MIVMDKKTLKRELRKYSGIGPANAEKLAIEFDHINDVKTATLKRLNEVLGTKEGKKVQLALKGKLYREMRKPKQKKEYATQSKYTKELGESIALMFGKGEATKEEICKAHRISVSTFDNWHKENLEFFSLIKNAWEKRKENLDFLSDIGMKKMLTGYTVQEKIIENLVNKETGDVIANMKQEKVIEKHIPPSSAMIIFTKVNVSNGRFKHVQHITYDTKDDDSVYDLSKLNDEELNQFEALVSKIKQKAL